MAAPIVTLLSDFGAGSGYPAQMKGVLLGLCPEARLVDISHEVPSFLVLFGQLLLRDVVSAFPSGTIHLAVVDPGVGSARRALLVAGGEKAPGHFFVGPDNGLLWPFAQSGGRCFELAEAAFRREPVSPTFHGRDVFAPAAAHLALGVSPACFGPEVLDPVKLACPRIRREGGASVGEVVHIDPFGNLISNLGLEDLPPVARDGLKVYIAGRAIVGLKTSYSQVAIGDWVALVGSSGWLEIGLREGSAVDELDLASALGMPVVVEPC
jgi:S-adenosylmethionine hydrolase